MPAQFHLDPKAEKARYDTHNNDSTDPKYRKFLNQLAQPMLAKLKTGNCGLDYGSGPGPTLSVIFNEQGYPSKNYDPYYANNKNLLEQKYDFVSCSETVEHFADPYKEFCRFDNLLRSKAYLGIMTNTIENDQEFADWYYHRDPTHICFYRKRTWEWTANNFNWQLEIPAKNIAIFHKN